MTRVPPRRVCPRVPRSEFASILEIPFAALGLACVGLWGYYVVDVRFSFVARWCSTRRVRSAALSP